jgi:hypothetical protein
MRHVWIGCAFLIAFAVPPVAIGQVPAPRCDNPYAAPPVVPIPGSGYGSWDVAFPPGFGYGSWGYVFPPGYGYGHWGIMVPTGHKPVCGWDHPGQMMQSPATAPDDKDKDSKDKEPKDKEPKDKDSR